MAITTTNMKAMDKAYILQGYNEANKPIAIYITAKNREFAIALFESNYPQYKWFTTIECPFVLERTQTQQP